MGGHRVCRRTAQSHKPFSIDELKGFPSGKGNCVPSEAVCGNQYATVGALGCYDPQEFAHALDGNLSIKPVLALDDDPLATANEFQVDSTVGMTAPRSRTE